MRRNRSCRVNACGFDDESVGDRWSRGISDGASWELSVWNAE